MFERFTDRARDVVRRALRTRPAPRASAPSAPSTCCSRCSPTTTASPAGVLADAGVRRRRPARRASAGTSAHGGVGSARRTRRRCARSASTSPRSWPGSRSPSARTRCARRRRPRAAAGGRRRYVGGPFSPRSKKVLELSLREALRLRHRHIGTEHILLGLLREGHGLAALVLTEAGVDLDDLRRRVEAALRTAA